MKALGPKGYPLPRLSRFIGVLPLVCLVSFPCSSCQESSASQVTQWPLPARSAYHDLVVHGAPSPDDDPKIFPGGPLSLSGTVSADHLEHYQACGQADCHPDITKQWTSSMHHLASFSNPVYLAAAKYTKERLGAKAVRWCAGCHDPVLLLSKTLDGPMDPSRPGGSAGVTCMICHSTTAIRDLTGNGRYVVDVPNVDVLEPDRILGGVVRPLLRLYAGPHRNGFLKPLHSEPEFCSSCHRVSLNPAINGYHWLRGQDQFGRWQRGGPSGRVARSFHSPATPQRCQDCHMPLVPSNDFGADEGRIRSHAFPGANTAVPSLLGHADQVERTTAFLEGSLRIDPIGLRWIDPGGVERYSIESPPTGLPARSQITLDLVVRNLRVGHTFPEGVLDNKDIWLELTLANGRGEVLYQSGGLDTEGNVRGDSHRYGAIFLDALGQRLDKRNAFDLRTAVFVHQIPPGGSDTVPFAFTLPEAVDELVVTARLRYRKVRRDYLKWAYAGRRHPDDPLPPASSPGDRGRYLIDDSIEVPTVPIVDVARVTKHFKLSAEHVEDERLNPERLHDYGIGFLLTDDTDRARHVFETQITRFPEDVSGYTGLARVALTIGDPEGAFTALEAAKKALDQLPLDDDEKWKRHGRIPAFWAQALSLKGDLEAAERLFLDVIEHYPLDGSLRRDLGWVRFRRKDYRGALDAYQAALRIDPDDRAAFAVLPRLYAALGRLDDARQAGDIFDALREDVYVQGLRQKWLTTHPDDALEAQPGHVHELDSM